MGKNHNSLGSVLFGFYRLLGFDSGSCLVCKVRVRVLFGSFKNDGSSSVRSVLVPSLVTMCPNQRSHMACLTLYRLHMEHRRMCCAVSVFFS